MKIFLITFLSILSVQLFAQGNQTPATTTMEVRPGNAYILKDNNAGGYYGDMRDSSTMLLFAYTYKSSQNDQIADDEYAEMLYFNVKQDKTGKFLLSGKYLQQAQAHFYKSCFCLNKGTYLVVSGSIKGTKMTKTTWYVNADVMIEVKNGDSKELVHKKIKGYFTITPQN